MPVAALDLVTAAHMRMSAYPPFVQLVAEGWIGADANGTPWLFQGLDNEGRPFRDPEGSGTSVVVLSERREWAGANAHNTAYFPRLQMLIYTDSDRAVDGSASTRNADRKCKSIFRVLDRCFHLVGARQEDRLWAEGFRVHACLRSGPFTLGDVPQTDGLTVRGEAAYDTITD